MVGLTAGIGFVSAFTTAIMMGLEYEPVISLQRVAVVHGIREDSGACLDFRETGLCAAYRNTFVGDVNRFFTTNMRKEKEIM